MTLPSVSIKRCHQFAAANVTDRVPRVVFGFTITGGKIVGIDMISDPTTLRDIELEPLTD